MPKMPKSRNEQTSKKVATAASRILSDPAASKAMKSVAASALTQAPDHKKPGKRG